MKKSTSNALCFVFLEISVVLIIIFALSIDLSQPIQEERGEGGNSKEGIIENCKNLSLVDSANCLRNNLKPIYIYNKTDDSLELSFEEIKARGGDCRDWAFLYEELGEILGFNSTTVRNDGVRGLYNPHRYAVIWNENDYCKLDLMGVNCNERK